MIDLLSGLLAGGGWGDAVTPLFGDTSVPYNSSQLFIAIDPGFFGSRQGFQDAAHQAAERIRSSTRADRSNEAPAARAPGDARHETRARNHASVPVAAAVLAKLVAAAERYDVPGRRIDDYLTPS